MDNIRLAIGILGAVLLLCTGGIILLSAMGLESHILNALATTCAGAIVGILVSPMRVPRDVPVPAARVEPPH